MLEQIDATQEHFELFKSEIQRLIKKFGLLDWYVYFDFKELEGCNAQVLTTIQSRAATFNYNKKNYHSTPDEIKECALHETCHLLIADVADLNYHRFISEMQHEQACESVAQRLTLILGELMSPVPNNL